MRKSQIKIKLLTKKQEGVVGWVGIVNKKIDLIEEKYGDSEEVFAIYKTKGAARTRYECVKKVKIIPL